MSAYRNFVEDFPRRCLEVLKLASCPARAQGREVTLMLMAASTGFVVPFERLRPDGHTAHPSGDNRRFAANAERLQQLFDERFLGSKVWGRSVGSWTFGTMKDVNGPPDAWPGLREGKPLSSEKTVKGVLKLVRNALAHANIYTQGNPIERLVFLTVKSTARDGHPKSCECLAVSPDDFRTFLQKWFRFLNDERIDQVAVCRELSDAA